jgi:LmbE family N-acetylglucosaminyl deacetylase
MDRVLAFGCHPDDVEFMAAGTLALLARQGFEIHIATMAGGEAGSPELTSAQIKAIRLKESEAAAALAGAHYHYAGGCDLEVEYNSEYRRMATRVIRAVDPLIVLTHAPTCYMVDHEETSRLVRNACYIASIPLYDRDAGLAPTHRFPYLYYWNAMGLTDIFGRSLPMQFGVDIGSVVELKERMLLCHESQRAWLEFHNGPDAYVNAQRGFNRKQGALMGCEHGECFMQHLGHGHPKDNILKKLLGDRVADLPVKKHVD